MSNNAIMSRPVVDDLLLRAKLALKAANFKVNNCVAVLHDESIEILFSSDRGNGSLSYYESNSRYFLDLTRFHTPNKNLSCGLNLTDKLSKAYKNSTVDKFIVSVYWMSSAGFYKACDSGLPVQFVQRSLRYRGYNKRMRDIAVV